ncbi:hypothetical protein APHAL10511_007654 [Amanita phalloides]|nr:hypothetical protein APHAL10511_007654 [Amanita phalloides]
MFPTRFFCLNARRVLISPSYRRCLATQHLHPSIHDFTKEVVKTQPKFLLSPNAVQVLSEPEQFYRTLLHMIRRAKQRVFLSSLYIGSSEFELLSELDAVLRNNPSLQLFIQLDLNRSTRPGSSTAKSLFPLLRDFPSRVHVYMFRSPALSGLAAKTVPPRFNEGWGTWHAKIYGADNEVMISGANLNKSYFTDRQDRYVHITSSAGLAQYCFSFLQTVSTFSYQLLPSDSQMAIRQHSVAHGDHTIQWLDPDTHPHHIHKQVRRALSSFQESQLDTLIPHSGTTGQDDNQPTASHITEQHVMIIPMIQAGQFGIREEENVLELLFRHLESYGQTSLRRPLLDLTTGYFGLYKSYQDFILKSLHVDTRIVCSAPRANGFFGSKGISGRIPEGYTYLEQQFMRAVRDANRCWAVDASGNGRGVELSEWERDGWTYHAKGIWLSPSPETLPILTMFGSTNLNSRSAHLDTELSFLMIVPSELQPADAHTVSHRISEASNSVIQLRSQLQAEIDRIREYVVDWKGGQRKVRRLTKAIVHLVRGML